MIEYKHIIDYPHSSNHGDGLRVNIVENGKLEELGKDGWDLVSVYLINEEMRDWVFKRTIESAPTPPKKQRGRPRGSKNKVKDGEAT